MRVLVVEDSFLVAGVIKDQLSDEGCEVVGPAGQLDEALRLATTEVIDVAVLDINLSDGDSVGVAEALAARDIPFLFLSGYDTESSLPRHLADRPVIGKPFRAEELSAAVQQLFRQ